MKLEMFEMFLHFQNCEFLDFSKLEIFRIFKIANFWNFQYWKFFAFSKLQIFGIFLITNFWNCLNWQINKFLEFFQIAKPKFGSKDRQFWNFSFIRYSALLAILTILIFTV